MTVYEVKIGNKERKLFSTKEKAISEISNYYGEFWADENLITGEIVGCQDSFVFTPIGNQSKAGAYMKPVEVY